MYLMVNCETLTVYIIDLWYRRAYDDVEIIRFFIVKNSVASSRFSIKFFIFAEILSL